VVSSTVPVSTAPSPPDTGSLEFLEGMAWEAAGIEQRCTPEPRRCTQLVVDPSGAPISYDPTSRTLTRHVRDDGEFVSAPVPESFGDIWLVAAGPDEVVYLNAITEPEAEGSADLVAVSLASGDAGREVGRAVDGGNPGVDFDFVVTPEGLVTTGWYEQGQRPAPSEALVMAWVDRNPNDDDSPMPGDGSSTNDVASIIIDAYERTVTVVDQTWTLDGPAAEFPPTGMPPIARTFDGGFIARYDQVVEEYWSVVVRGWPDGTIDEWAVPGDSGTAFSIVPEPMGTVLLANDGRYVRASPFESSRVWDGRFDINFDTGAVDVTDLNDDLSALEPDDLEGSFGIDPVAFAAAAIGMPTSPAVLVTIDYIRSNDTAHTVVATNERLLDDSVYGVQWTFTIQRDLTAVDAIKWANSCQPQRGHQDYQTALCT